MWRGFNLAVSGGKHTSRFASDRYVLMRVSAARLSNYLLTCNVFCVKLFLSWYLWGFSTCNLAKICRKCIFKALRTWRTLRYFLIICPLKSNVIRSSLLKNKKRTSWGWAGPSSAQTGTVLYLLSKQLSNLDCFNLTWNSRVSHS